MNREAQILQALQGSLSLGEKRALVDELNTIRSQARRRVATAREVELGAEAAAAHLTPAPTYVRHTSDTDWLGRVASTRTSAAERTQMAKSAATSWWRSTSPIARVDPTELNIQAVGAAQRWASQWGEMATEAADTFLQYASHLAGMKLGQRSDDDPDAGLDDDPDAGRYKKSGQPSDDDAYDDRLDNDGEMEDDEDYDGSKKESRRRTASPSFRRESSVYDVMMGQAGPGSGVVRFKARKDQYWKTTHFSDQGDLERLLEGQAKMLDMSGMYDSPEEDAKYSNVLVFQFPGAGANSDAYVWQGSLEASPTLMQFSRRTASKRTARSGDTASCGFGFYADDYDDDEVGFNSPGHLSSRRTAISYDEALSRIEHWCDQNGCVMKDFPDDLIEFVADTGQFDYLTDYLEDKTSWGGFESFSSLRTAGRTSVEYYSGSGGEGYWTFYTPSNSQYGTYATEQEAAEAASRWEEENPTLEDFLTAPGPYTLGDRRKATIRSTAGAYDQSRWVYVDGAGAEHGWFTDEEKAEMDGTRTSDADYTWREITDAERRSMNSWYAEQSYTQASLRTSEADGIDSPSPDSQNGYAESTLPDVSVTSAPEDTNMGWIADGDPNADSAPRRQVAILGGGMPMGSLVAAFMGHTERKTASVGQIVRDSGWSAPLKSLEGESQPRTRTISVDALGQGKGNLLITMSWFWPDYEIRVDPYPGMVVAKGQTASLGVIESAAMDWIKKNVTADWYETSRDNAIAAVSVRKQAEADGIDSPSQQSQNGYAESGLPVVEVSTAPEDTNLGWIADGDPNSDPETFESPDNPIANEASRRTAGIVTIFDESEGRTIKEQIDFLSGVVGIDEAEEAIRKVVDANRLFCSVGGWAEINDVRYNWTRLDGGGSGPVKVKVGLESFASLRTAAEVTRFPDGHSEWKCNRCKSIVERWPGESDVSCDCGAEYNASGQQLRDDWRGNSSNWDDEVSDMDGYENQHAYDDRDYSTQSGWNSAYGSRKQRRTAGHGDITPAMQADIDAAASALGVVGEDLRQGDWYDVWGTAMMWGFALNDYIVDRGGRANPTFQQAMGGSDTDSYEYQVLSGGGVSVAAAEKAERAIDALLDKAKAAGLDY